MNLQVKAAEAEAESKYLSGVGVSRQRKAIVDGLRDSVLTFSEKIGGKWSASCGKGDFFSLFIFYLFLRALFLSAVLITFYFTY